MSFYQSHINFLPLCFLSQNVLLCHLYNLHSSPWYKLQRRERDFLILQRNCLLTNNFISRKKINTSITTKVVGKVVGCPGVMTGNTFHMQWGYSMPLNSIDPKWLQPEIPPTTSNMKALLQEAINQYYASANYAGMRICSSWCCYKNVPCSC